MASKTGAYTAYVLTEAARQQLLSKFPPKFPDVIAHHVTVQFGVPKDAATPEPAEVKAVGYAADDSLEAIVVEVNGTSQRPDGSTYHITLSLDRSKGRKPVDSNKVVKEGWEPVEPMVLETMPQKLATATNLKIGNGAIRCSECGAEYDDTDKTSKWDKCPHCGAAIFWSGEGAGASGVLPVCSSTGNVCLAWRSPRVHMGNCWGTIGGAVQQGMNPQQSAKEEMAEETGYRGGMKLIPAFVFTSGTFKYHNFIGVVDSEFGFSPEEGHDWETIDIKWVPYEQVVQDMHERPKNYHPGLVKLFANSGHLIEKALKITKQSAAQKNPALDEFMRDMWSQTYQNPYDNSERVWQDKACFTARPFQGRIHLSLIRSLQHGKGQGSEALKWFCDLADKHGVAIELEADVPHGAEGGLSQPQLMSWYKRYGFRSGRNREYGADNFLVREPKKTLKLGPTMKTIPMEKNASISGDTAELLRDGKKFVCAMADLLDGYIEETHTYVEMSAGDWHHSLVFSDEAVRQDRNDRWRVFWVTDEGEIGCNERDITPEVEAKIKAQFKPLHPRPSGWKPPKKGSTHPDFLYHGTSRDNRDSILKNGLLRSMSDASQTARAMGEISEDAQGGIFFHTVVSPNDLKRDTIDTWKVDVRGLDLERDTTTEHDESDPWWVAWYQDIPPDRLELMSKNPPKQGMSKKEAAGLKSMPSKVAAFFQKSASDVTLADLYNGEKPDEDEGLGNYLSQFGRQASDDIFYNRKFQVRTLSPEQVKQLKVNDSQTVLEVYTEYAERWQKQLVKKKIKNFDPNRIIVLDGGYVLDGNHHTIAAIQLNQPVKYIDLEEPESEPKQAAEAPKTRWEQMLETEKDKWLGPAWEQSRNEPWVEYVPISELLPLREYHWTESYNRHGGDEYRDMVEDMKRHGVREPITIRYFKDTNRAKIIEGNHRVSTAQAAGLKEVPARVAVASYPQKEYGKNSYADNQEGGPVRGLLNPDERIYSDYIKPSDIGLSGHKQPKTASMWDRVRSYKNGKVEFYKGSVTIIVTPGKRDLKVELYDKSDPTGGYTSQFYGWKYEGYSVPAIADRPDDSTIVIPQTEWQGPDGQVKPDFNPVFTFENKQDVALRQLNKHLAKKTAATLKLYHGSKKKFPVGFVLKPQSDGYLGYDDEMVQQTERILEKNRPEGALSRSKCVFMVSDPDEIDSAGGYEDYVYEVQPIGKVEKNDMDWYSSLGIYLWDDENDPEAVALAKGYWSGKAKGDKHTLFEYRSPEARITRVVFPPEDKTASFSIEARPTPQKVELLKQQFQFDDPMIENIIRTDPTERDYVYWIGKNVANGSIRLPEDADKIKTQLTTFNKLKRSPKFQANRDIGTYTPATLYETLEQNSKAVSNKEQEREQVQSGARIILSQGDFKVYKIDPKELAIDPGERELDEAAAALCQLSGGTNWCTAQNHYSKQYLDDGPSFVMFYRNSAYAQLHPKSDQFMDRTDEPLTKDITWSNPVENIVYRRGLIVDPTAQEFIRLLMPNNPEIQEWYKTYDPVNIPAEELTNPRDRVAVALAKGQRLPEESERLIWPGLDWQLATKYITTFIKQRVPAWEHQLLTNKSHMVAINAYCEQVIGGRWKTFEDLMDEKSWIGSTPLTELVRYCKNTMGGRWLTVEGFINQALKLSGHPQQAREAAVDYAANVLKAPWSSVKTVGRSIEDDFLEAIDDQSVDYAAYVLKRRWPELEELLLVGGDKRYLGKSEEIKEARSPYMHFSLHYAEKVIHGPWEAFERKMLRPIELNPWVWSFAHPPAEVIEEYVEKARKSRWPELEKLLLSEQFHEGVKFTRRPGTTFVQVLEAYLKALKTLGLSWPEGEAEADKLSDNR